MVDPWEAMQPEYMPTALVLDHVDREVNTVLGGAVQPDGSTRKIQIILLAGAGEPQYSLVWSNSRLYFPLRHRFLECINSWIMSQIIISLY